MKDSKRDTCAVISSLGPLSPTELFYWMLFCAQHQKAGTERGPQCRDKTIFPISLLVQK